MVICENSLLCQKTQEMCQFEATAFFCWFNARLDMSLKFLITSIKLSMFCGFPVSRGTLMSSAYAFGCKVRVLGWPSNPAYSIFGLAIFGEYASLRIRGCIEKRNRYADIGSPCPEPLLD